MTDPMDFLDGIIGLIILEISDQEFCLGIKDIYTILNPKDLNQPSIYSPSNPYLTADKLIVPIIDMHRHFGFKRSEETADTRIIITENGSGGQFGFFVECVKEVFTMSKNLKERFEYIPYKGKLFLKGVLKLKERVLYFPDLTKISDYHFAIEQPFKGGGIN